MSAIDVFISYASRDKAIAEATCRALEAGSIRCWIAPRDILPGKKYAEAIVEAINQCQIFLLVLSQSGNTSRQVEMEVDRAASKGIPILSFRIEEVVLSKTMEYYLSSIHWLDANKAPVEAHLPTLVSTVQNLLRPAGGQEAERAPAAEPKRAERVTAVDQPLPPAEGMTEKNPFTFGNPISDPQCFFGREAEIRQIVNRLRSSAHESTSIIGERRIGKTSLLQHLAHPQVSARLGLSAEQYCLVYTDFQGLTDITPERFWQRILKKMGRAIHDQELQGAIEKLGATEVPDLFDLEDLFETTQSRGMTVVLMMDEFEYVTLNPNFRGDFFGGLRALAIHHGVALLPATRGELADMCHSKDLKGSPFFNIFANVVLRPFQRDEVEAMVDGYAASCGLTLGGEEKERIWELGGGYPFFTQIAGHYLVEANQQKLTGTALEKFVDEHFDLQANAHYSYIFAHCSDSEKVTLLAVLALSRQDPAGIKPPAATEVEKLYSRASRDLDTLGKRGMISGSAGVCRIFSSSFSRWVMNEVAARGREPSAQEAEDWLKSAAGGRNGKELQAALPAFNPGYWSLIKDMPLELLQRLQEAVARGDGG